ncbi:MAG: Rv3654c family TadE-like protein [Candidatus Nanopelagicales bacterium]
MKGSDEGAATIWAVALLAVIGLAATASGGVAALAVARQRVALAADLAALAAASSWADPCTAAAGSAEANGAVLLSCARDGPDVLVAVAAPVPPLAGRVFALLGHPVEQVTATARAGPS